MSKHTKEPWKAWTRESTSHTGITGPTAVSSCAARDGIAKMNELHGWTNSCCVVESESKESPLLALGDDVENAEANAIRAVACVNALAGLNPEAVKDVVDAAIKLANLAEPLTPFGDAAFVVKGGGKALAKLRTALAKIGGGE